MEHYNYLEAITEDVKTFLKDNYTMEELLDADWARLHDAMWNEDSVTGNGSGSYTFSSEQAEEFVNGNEELAKEAYRFFAFGKDQEADEELQYDMLYGFWEIIDVTIRCYLLQEALGEALATF